MIHIDVRHDIAGLQARLQLLPKERMQAAVRALNRTMTTVRAEASREMRKAYPGLKVSTLKRRIRFTRATRAKALATLTFSAKRFRLVGNWNVRQTKQGIRGRLPWRLETADGTEIPASALRQGFIRAATNTGVSNVWLRDGKARYPIQAVLAPGLNAAFVERHIGRALSRTARARFAVVFEQEARFRLSRRT